MRFCLKIILLQRLCLGAVMLLSSPLLSQALELKAGMAGLPLRSALMYYRDHGGKMTVEQAAALPADAYQPVDRENYGYTSDVFWLKLRVHNPSGRAREWIALLDYTPIDSVSLYQKQEKGPWLRTDTGDRHHFAGRGFWYRKPNLKVMSGPGSEQVLYFRIESRSMLYVNLEAWDRESLTRAMSRETLILGGFYMAMWVMMAYSLFLYALARDFYYIPFIIYILTYILLQMVLDGMAFQVLWPGALDWASIALPFFIDIAAIGLLDFSILYLDLKKNAPVLRKLMFALMGILGIGALLSLLLGIEQVDWSVRAAVLMSSSSFVVCLITGIVCFKRRVRPARYYLLAWAGLIFLNLWRGAEVTFALSPTPIISNYAVHIGSLLLIFLFSVALANRINLMRLNLGLRVEALNKANVKIEHSERKYRQLVESSKDIMFSLDGDLTFLSFNHALENSLGYREHELLGKNISEIFYVDGGHYRPMTESLYIKDKLEELKRTRGRVAFNLSLKSLHLHEPREMFVSLEYINTTRNRPTKGRGDLSRVEILGKATSIAEDIYSEYLLQENHVYAMESYLGNAELLSRRLTRNLNKYLDRTEVSRLRIALRELLINAIEHGNLNISFEEKTAALEERRYLNLVQERQEDEALRSRRVQVDYSLNSERYQVRIRDEGAGFAHETLRRESIKKANAQNLGHGRGLAMADYEFDEMTFNERGNEVLLVKYLRVEWPKPT